MPIPDQITVSRTGPEAMEQLGRELADCCPHGCRIFLQGQLGAGKTTLVRGFLRGRGYEGKVKSPTYTLVEPYTLGALTINHIDLYRINGATDLEGLGWREYLDGSATCLLEWPERGNGRLGEPDVLIKIQMLDDGRELTLCAKTGIGRTILAEFAALQ